jgi:spore cortex formation protein SpoVR/YcgB (stage V sporulation)
MENRAQQQGLMMEKILQQISYVTQSVQNLDRTVQLLDQRMDSLHQIQESLVQHLEHSSSSSSGGGSKRQRSSSNNNNSSTEDTKEVKNKMSQELNEYELERLVEKTFPKLAILRLSYSSCWHHSSSFY